MSCISSSAHARLVRYGTGLLVLLFALASLPAQNPGGTKEEKEPPVRPKNTEEKEDPGKRKPFKKIRVGDEEPETGPSGQPAVAAAADLAAAARQAKDRSPRTYEFLAGLIVPHDEIAWGGNTYRIEPITEYVIPGKSDGGKLTVRVLDKQMRFEYEYPPIRNRIERFTPYEQLVQDRAARFLGLDLSRAPEEAIKSYVHGPEQLAAAELALAQVLRFHRAERDPDRGRRRGAGWDAVENRLKKALFQVQVLQLQDRIGVRDWDGAFAQADRLARLYPQPEDQLQLARPLAQLILEELGSRGANAEDRRKVLAWLRRIEERFPQSDALRLINHRLKAEAEALLRRAQELEKSRPKEAQDLLQRAAELWPRLPELRDRRLRLNREYAVLRVGVRELPRHLWPHLAFTDPERQAVELLFEGLVRIGPDPAAGRAYLPGLAEARPRLIPLGRQFQLAQRVAWSNGEPITADDVVHTVNLLKDPKWSGYSPAWAELIDAAQVGDEPGTVSLTLKQGFLDPLALMTFKILPRQPFHDAARPGAADLRSLDDHRLETAPPVGSGPFVYSGRRTAGSGLPDADVFVANPWWRQDEIQGLAAATAGKARAAQIREVHLVRSDDPARAFASGSLDLALDLRADQVRGLLELVLPPPPGAGPRAEGRKLVVPPPLPNRRIYFLAVNHRDAALRDREGVPPDRDPGRLLRRALAHAIERGKILDRCCRVEPGEKAHRPLNGPYPPSSWACAADLPSLDQPELARTLIQAAVKAGLSKKSFTLKYANDDSHAEQVLAELKRQVEQTLAEADIALELRPLPPHTLRKQVEQTHDYELAYYHYDYPSETYWLWPLFHPRGTGSGRSNYLGYANDSELASLFSKAMSRRDFTEVCRLTQLIHRVFHDKLPFIPLWQLDTRIAFHPDLKMGTIDPLLVFPTIEQWRLDRQ